MAEKAEVLPATISGSELEAAIRGEIDVLGVELEDPQAIADAIVARILAAPDADTVLEQQGTTHARDMLGVPFTVENVRWNRSAVEGGAAVYALIEVVTADEGEKFVVTCGSRNVMAQLFRLQQLGELGNAVYAIEEASTTARGFKPMWLKRLDKLEAA